MVAWDRTAGVLDVSTSRAGASGEAAALAGDSTFVYANRYYDKNVTTSQETLSYWLGNQLVAVKKGGALNYVHQDHLGSTAVVTDTAGNTASSLTYLPFGGTRASSGLLPTDRKFTGQRLDNPVDLYFYNARYYDAGLGRFVSPDSIVPDPANPQDFNRFTYVRNNPTKYTDPDGHCPICPAVIALVASPWGQAAIVATTGIVAQWLWSTAKDARDDAIDEAWRSLRELAGGGTAQPGDPKDPFKGVSEKTQTHHIVSNINKTKWTSRFEEITNKYGLDLDDDWNKLGLPEEFPSGRHTDKYHEWVLRQLKDIDVTARGDREVFLELFDERIRQEILRNPGIVQMK